MDYYTIQALNARCDLDFIIDNNSHAAQAARQTLALGISLMSADEIDNFNAAYKATRAAHPISDGPPDKYPAALRNLRAKQAGVID